MVIDVIIIVIVVEKVFNVSFDFFLKKSQPPQPYVAYLTSTSIAST